jgi:prepilin-type N-terminal cleavage/methylation domain-containing protein
MTVPRANGAQAGFTLIEVLVALTILAAALLGFYEFLSSSLAAARRAYEASAVYDRQQNAIALSTHLNPMEQPGGTFDLGQYRIRWKAFPVGEVRRNTAYPTGSGPFSVDLYRVVLDFPDDPTVAAVEVVKLGYRREQSGEIAPNAPE